MKLWFITSDTDGDNHDLFVWARNIRMARMQWMIYYGREGKWDCTNRVWLVPTTKPKEAAAVEWHKDIKVITESGYAQ